MNIELIKAIFAAGYRVGYEEGAVHTNSFELGFKGVSPDSEKAWKENVEHYLSNPKHWSTRDWENIP